MVGGILPNEANTIAFNGINGVNVILMAMNNSIRGNNIRSNGNLGIEVSSIGFPSDGVTANDPDDIDSGPNGFQNYPENLVVGFGPSTQVTGNLDSSPNSTFIVDFYFNTQLNASGRGEGELYLGSTTVTTDANGDATFSAANLPPVSAGGFLTATATDEMGNTSEFSDTAVTQATGSISGVKFEDLNGNGSRAIGIQGDNPHVVFVVDVSGSSRGPFQGTPVGNQNPDIDDISDSVLDAEIRAFEVLNERLESVLADGLIQSALVSIVAFNIEAQTVLAPTSVPNRDVIEEALRNLESDNLTSYEAALTESLSVLTDQGTNAQDANIIFLSDGLPNHCLLYTSPSPRDQRGSRMPSSA